MSRRRAVSVFSRRAVTHDGLAWLQSIILGVVIAALMAGTSAQAADEKGKKNKGPTDFERLVELNADALFGTEVKVKNGRFTAVFGSPGAVGKGFDLVSKKPGTGVIPDSKLVKNASVRKILIDGAKGKFSFVALTSGTAMSKFQLEDDYKISFKLRLPTAAKKSRITWYLNRDGKRSYVRLTNLNELGFVSDGDNERAMSKDARFRGVLGKWFDRKSPGVPIELEFKNGQATVRMEAAGKGKPEMTKVVSLDGIESPRAGKLALAFDGVSFLVTDFRIDGRLPEGWLKKEIETLKEDGRFKALEKKEPAKDGEKGEGGDAKKVEKKKGPDIDKPDPESDEDL